MILGALGASATVALAGCLGDDADDSSDDDTGDPADDDTGDDTTAALDEAVDFPDDETCAVCNMEPAEHPEWNAQLVKADETRVYFCSSGCLLAYYTHPAQFDGDDTAVEAVWVTDYETGDLIDGMDATYVRVESPDHVDDIMMMNPTPFADHDDAEAFIETLNDDPDIEMTYDDSDIITFDDFDADLATHYRSNFLSGDDGHGHGDDGHDH